MDTLKTDEEKYKLSFDYCTLLTYCNLRPYCTL